MLNNLTPLKQNKDKQFQTQMRVVYNAFLTPKTMLMVSIETGIMRSNITRYVSKWRKADKIETVRKGVCPITKHSGVQYLTTNRDLFSIVQPLNNGDNGD